MKRKIISILFALVMLVTMAGMPAPALATNGGVILHPGYLTGSVTVNGYNITNITVSAMDTAGVFQATTTNATGGTASIGYTLAVEGDRDYYLIAEAVLVAPDDTTVITPVHGPKTVGIGATVTQDVSVNPAFISGTLSTTTTGKTIQNFRAYAWVGLPQFPYRNFHNITSNFTLSLPGIPGKDYTLPVAPGLEYNFYVHVTVNCIEYIFDMGTIGPFTEGEIYPKDFELAVTAATIHGTALLVSASADVSSASVEGLAYIDPHYLWVSRDVDISTGEYTLPVTAGTWNVHPIFYFTLTTGDLAGKVGYLRPPTTPITLADGDYLEHNFNITPGYITGAFILTGASTSTDIHSGFHRAEADPVVSRGEMYATLLGGSGKYMFVASPGAAWRHRDFELHFDYPGDPDTSLWSEIKQFYPLPGTYTVASGEILSDVNLAYGTATVRLYYTVAGGGELSSPEFLATRVETPYTDARAYGSSALTTEGQAMGTLFPGTWTIEAFANVGGSRTEFGTFTVTVEEGDVVVIGGVARPTIHVTNPTEGQVIPAASVTVVGTATDDVGIASITINGSPVSFTPTGGPDNEVAFSHVVSLPVVGENTITVVAQDTDGTPPVTLELTVIREEVAAIPTILTYTGATLASVNTLATLAARLVDQAGQPISGATISFQIGSQTLTAVTGTDGVASCQVTTPSDAGVYEVIVQYAGDATHQGSTTTALLTVYNPEGGFVTGGGWIVSPQGAYTADPTLTGRANFGFVSKYLKGATTPTGQTEFQFKVAKLNFHSESYEWLVVAGARAQYKGTGTINGAGSYKFMLTAIDGDLLAGGKGPDKFRMKIWDDNGPIYDNQLNAPDNDDPTTVISGGSIVIHK